MTDAVHMFVSKCGNFEFAIKKEFLKLCADPAKEDMHRLMTEFHIGKHLHNPYGPAIRNLKVNVGYVEYWIEGKKASAEVAEKIKHQASFTDNLNKLLDE